MQSKNQALKGRTPVLGESVASLLLQGEKQQSCRARAWLALRQHGHDCHVKTSAKETCHGMAARDVAQVNKSQS